MTDTEVQTEVQHTSETPTATHQQEDMNGTESLHNIGQEEFEEPLSLLATVALSPLCGDLAPCTCDCEPCREMEKKLQSMNLHLQFLMSKADDLQDRLVNGQGDLDREALAAAVPSFLNTCQPFFNHLESTSAMSQQTPLHFDIFTRRVQLLDFSQQLCDRLEQLVLTYASYNLLCLDETKPDSVSHFCIGQRQVGTLRLTMFRYCKPTLCLTWVESGLYKRMRWNVERLRDEQQRDEESEEREAETDDNTEYYFLCYEDIPKAHGSEDSQGVSDGNVVRMWSIGQWVQVTPKKDDIYEWIMCEVPQGGYHRLVFLGSEEPSSYSATEYLQHLLVSPQTAE